MRFDLSSAKWFVIFVGLLASCATGTARVSNEQEAEAAYKYGIAYLGSNPLRLQNAYIEFQKAIEANPRHKDAHYALGHVQFQQEDYPAAARSFLRAIEIDADFSDAHNHLGKVYEVMGNTEKAVAEYHKALENPKYDAAQKPHLNLGLLYLREKAYDRALQAFRSVLRIAPQHAVAYNGIGQSHFYAHNTREAIAAYKEAIRIAPDYLDAHHNLAIAYVQQERYDLAAEEYQRVLSLAPESGAAMEAKRFLEMHPPR